MHSKSIDEDTTMTTARTEVMAKSASHDITNPTGSINEEGIVIGQAPEIEPVRANATTEDAPGQEVLTKDTIDDVEIVHARVRLINHAESIASIVKMHTRAQAAVSDNPKDTP